MDTLKRPVRYLVVIGLLFAASAQIIKGQSGIVEDLEVRGNRTVSREAIMNRIKTRPGEPFSRKQADEDFENVLRIGVFDKDASKLQIEPAPKGGVAVIFVLKETIHK